MVPSLRQARGGLTEPTQGALYERGPHAAVEPHDTSIFVQCLQRRHCGCSVPVLIIHSSPQPASSNVSCLAHALRVPTRKHHMANYSFHRPASFVYWVGAPGSESGSKHGSANLLRVMQTGGDGCHILSARNPCS